MTAELFNLTDYEDKDYEDESIMHCECGGNVFLISEEDGIVCLNCDGKLENWEVTPA